MRRLLYVSLPVKLSGTSSLIFVVVVVVRWGHGAFSIQPFRQQKFGYTSNKPFFPPPPFTFHKSEKKRKFCSKNTRLLFPFVKIRENRKISPVSLRQKKGGGEDYDNRIQI